jgi:hypothetical protein
VLAPDSFEHNRSGRTISCLQNLVGILILAKITSNGKIPLIFVENDINTSAQRSISHILE